MTEQTSGQQWPNIHNDSNRYNDFDNNNNWLIMNWLAKDDNR